MLTIYKASAGSGKTYQLTYYYIRLALGYINDYGKPTLITSPYSGQFAKILAITFTKKATKEMKERIIAALYGIATGGDNPQGIKMERGYVSQLMDYYNASELKIITSARQALSNILQNFSDFNISTIDSFFQDILRSFTYDLDLDGDYGVELADDEIRKIAIASLAQQTADERIASIMQRMMSRQISEGKSFDLFSEKSNIFSISKVLSTETYKGLRDKISEYLADGGVRMEKFRSLVNEHCAPKSLLARTESIIGDVLALCPDILSRLPKNRSLSNFIINVQTRHEVKFTDAFISQLSSLESDGNGDAIYKKNSVPDASESISRILLGLLDVYHCSQLTDVAKNLDATLLLNQIQNNINSMLADNSSLLLSSTNDLISRIITSSEGVPFIYDRVGVYLEHYLIDEFQDTSQMQWQNLSPLVEESLSKGKENLIIGDVKQSIYRFRNAEPELIRSRVAEQFHRFMEPSEEVKSTNWRSHREIVQFNNMLFSGSSPESLVARLGSVYADLYQDAEQNISKQEHPGFVSINFNDTAENNAEVQESEPQKETLSEASARIAPIRRLVQDLQSRGFAQRDIAILVNSAKDGTQLIQDFIEDNAEHPDYWQIEFVSEQSLLLKNSTAVKIIINILRLIQSNTLTYKSDREDDEVQTDDDTDSHHTDIKKSCARFVASFFKQLTRQNSALKDCDMHSIIDNAVEDSTQYDPSDYIARSVNSLYLIIEQIIAQNVPHETLQSDMPFIHALQDAVLDFSQNNIPTLRNFLLWWDVNADALAIASPEKDAVRVMTIHKSKGLEFPVVIIPNCTWQIQGNALEKTLWLDATRQDSTVRDWFTSMGIPSDLLPPLIATSKQCVSNTPELSTISADILYKETVDNLNKTYVAFTRAVQEMHIFFLSQRDKAKTAKDSSATNRTIYDFLFEYFEGKNYTLGSPTQGHLRPFVQQNAVTDYPICTQSLQRYRAHVEEYLDKKEFDLTSEERKDGILYHSIMSDINTIDDIHRAVARRASLGKIAYSEVEEKKEEILGYISQSELTRSWFAHSNRLIKERTMCSIRRDRSQTFISRADRIIVTPDSRAIVVDYKFGSNHQHDAKYHRQVLRYMGILQRLNRFRSIEGYIWYPRESLVIPIKPLS